MPVRPKLTMPPDEAAALARAYAGAAVILEYGSGGSTILAAEMPGKLVFSVESDKAWLAGMARWFAENPPAADLRLHHADIGPTGPWGKPLDDASFRKWPGYPNSVWDREDFAHPDVVLIDGRFRAACFATVALRITRPVTVLVDDYIDRPAYHEVESLAPRAEMIGRMARFELAPQPFPAQRMGWFLSLFLRPG
ncbi:hypothetical protein [Phaeovulum sp.]|uniref:hypothetical protein n=1 Tax=Phaeovulum sp. TaxID=2934796 RepID=UPI002AB94C6E|nr:hypothetical protein [Phaeovulum sp.]MDZ4119039.1 hypothetical protein [Phaeovulum sp.]